MLAAAGLVSLTPGGGAICWPLLDGRHIHIGWSLHAGHPTDMPTVYLHAEHEPVSARAASGFSQPHTPGAMPAPSQWLPSAGSVALVIREPLLWPAAGDPHWQPRAYREPPEPPPPRPA